MLKTLSSLAAALLVCGIPLSAPASAEPLRIVQYGDLDLSSPDGQKALTDRLRWAVRNVCGTPNPLEVREVMQTNRCRRDAREAVEHRAERAIAAYLTSDRFASRR